MQCKYCSMFLRLICSGSSKISPLFRKTLAFLENSWWRFHHTRSSRAVLEDSGGRRARYLPRVGRGFQQGKSLITSLKHWAGRSILIPTWLLPRGKGRGPHAVWTSNASMKLLLGLTIESFQPGVWLRPPRPSSPCSGAMDALSKHLQALSPSSRMCFPRCQLNFWSRPSHGVGHQMYFPVPVTSQRPAVRDWLWSSAPFGESHLPQIAHTKASQRSCRWRRLMQRGYRVKSRTFGMVFTKLWGGYVMGTEKSFLVSLGALTGRKLGSGGKETSSWCLIPYGILLNKTQCL